jgi:hypothetical protein
MNSSHSDHRRSDRVPVGMNAECRTQSGLFGRVEIVDLTPEGCRIFAKGLPLRVEQHVRVRPDNFQPIAGTIRWVENDFAGIRFDNPLYGPVAEHLQRTFGRDHR